MSDDGAISRIQPTAAESQKAQQASAAQRLNQYMLVQESGTDDYQEDVANLVTTARRNFDTLDSRVKRKGREEESSRTEKALDEEEVLPVEALTEISDSYERKNPELQSNALLILRSRITRQDTRDDVLRKVREFYPDPALADEALDFLIATADSSTRNAIQGAKDELNRIYEREIKAGQNMGAQAREFASQGLGTPTNLRDLYRDITGNPREATTLFNELTTNYTYDKMKSVIDFILHSMGSDLRSKGPSISRQELGRLMTEARSLQAILSVYRYFTTRIPLITTAFERQGLVLPARVTFETLAKLYVKFLQERYPSVDKALQLSQQLGISDEALAQLIIYTQFRDAIRQTAPKLFKNDQHRQEMLMCFIETLEELDEELEEDEEDDEKKDKDKDKDEKEKGKK